MPVQELCVFSQRQDKYRKYRICPEQNLQQFGIAVMFVLYENIGLQ